jgi:hypothetical protein
MNCAEVRKHLNQLVEERDTDQLSPQLHRHLKECAACRGEFQSVRETVRLLATMPRVAPGPDFSAGWRSRIRLQAPAQAGGGSCFAFLGRSSLRPVLGGILAVTISLSFYKMIYTNRRPAPLAVRTGNAGQPEVAALKRTVPDTFSLAATDAAATYQLQIERVGPKSQEIQKIIRNFTNSHEGGYALSYREQRDNLMVFNGLTRTEARELQKKLEQAGAVVTLTLESK